MCKYIFLQSKMSFLKLEYMQISNCDVVSWAIRGFPSCVLGSCFFYECWVVSGDGAKTFFAFIFLVDLKHGAICQTVLECTLATIFELWVNVLILLHHALQYIKLEIHSGPNLLGNYKAYISSVFKRCRFCSSTVLFGVSDNLWRYDDL